MTKPTTPNPQPTPGVGSVLYVWPKSKDAIHGPVYDALAAQGWRYDAVTATWWTPVGEPEQYGGLAVEADGSRAWIRRPSEMVDGQPHIGATIWEWSPTPERPPFPVADWDEETCPACGSTHRTVQYVEDAEVVRYLGKDDDGSFYAYDYRTGDGSNDRIECYSCGATWSVPEEIDYR